MAAEEVPGGKENRQLCCTSSKTLHNSFGDFETANLSRSSRTTFEGVLDNWTAGTEQPWYQNWHIIFQLEQEGTGTCNTTDLVQYREDTTRGTCTGRPDTGTVRIWYNLKTWYWYSSDRY